MKTIKLSHWTTSKQLSPHKNWMRPYFKAILNQIHLLIDEAKNSNEWKFECWKIVRENLICCDGNVTISTIVTNWIECIDRTLKYCIAICLSTERGWIVHFFSLIIYGSHSLWKLCCGKLSFQELVLDMSDEMDWDGK